MSRSEQSNGFSVVELLLALVAVGIIVFAGWYVWQAKHNTDKITNSSAQVANSTAKFGKSSRKPIDTRTEQATQYVDIKEWGIRAPYTGNLKLTYALSSDGSSAVFSSDQLSATSTDCVGRGGVIKRWASSDKVSEGPPDASTPTAATYFASADPSTYVRIGSYYYMFEHDQAACGDLTSSATLQPQTNDAVKALVPKLQSSPN